MKPETTYRCERCGAESDSPADCAARYCPICGVYERELEGMETPAAPIPHAPDPRAAMMAARRAKLSRSVMLPSAV